MATVKVIVPPPVEQPPVKVQMEMSLDEAKAIYVLVGGTNKATFEDIKKTGTGPDWAPQDAKYSVLYYLYESLRVALKDHIK